MVEFAARMSSKGQLTIPSGFVNFSSLRHLILCGSLSRMGEPISNGDPMSLPERKGIFRHRSDWSPRTSTI